MNVDLQQRASRIRLAIFDVDGVLTDGGIYRLDDGQEAKRFHVRDGLGLRMLIASGIEVAIITGRRSQLLEHRAKELGIQHLFQGCKDKLPVFNDLLASLNLSGEQCSHMGDDLPDLCIMQNCGLALTVADGHQQVVAHCHWQSRLGGGYGAVREACEMILDSQGKLDDAYQRFLNA